MNIHKQITNYINSQPEPKRLDMLALHNLVLQVAPETKLWFLDGKNDEGKMVTNPNIGYGFQTLHYADGTSREFYKIGFSTNTSGISFYVIGIEDKNYLADRFAGRLGKATVTGYCIKFKSLKDIDITVLEEVIKFGLER